MFNKIKNGWYIILYHDINWEDSVFTQYIGGTCAPNIFFEQIELMKSIGQFVNIEDGTKLLNKEQIDKPYFSIWFDDGLKGVINHAYPILNHFNIKQLSDLPTLDELGSAGLIDTSAVDPSIFGTGKFFKEQSSQKKENIYSDIEKVIDETPKSEE